MGHISVQSSGVKSGGTARFKAKRNVEFVALKTTRTKATNKSSWFGLCGSHASSSQEESHGRAVSAANLEAISETGSVDVVGTSLNVAGTIHLEAKKGRVTVKDHVLRYWQQ